MSKSAHTDDYKKVTDRLKQARLEAGLSQQLVAEQISKPQSYISKVESGERRLDIVEIKVLAKVYKKKIDYFLD